MNEILNKPFSPGARLSEISEWQGNTPATQDEPSQPPDQLEDYLSSFPPSVVGTLVTASLTSSRPMFADMMAALSQGDVARVASQAHQLRGGLCKFAAPKLSSALTELEVSCRNDNRIPEAFKAAELPEFFSEFEARLKEYLTTR